LAFYYIFQTTTETSGVITQPNLRNFHTHKVYLKKKSTTKQSTICPHCPSGNNITCPQSARFGDSLPFVVSYPYLPWSICLTNQKYLASPIYKYRRVESFKMISWLWPRLLCK